MSRTWPAAVMVAVMSLPVCPASTRSLNEQGNEAYRRTRYDDALRSYTEAQVDSPVKTLLFFFGRFGPIRVVFPGQLPITFFYLLSARVIFQTKQMIKIIGF